MLESLTILDLFFLLPIWAGYEGDNLGLWALVALLLLSPAALLLWREYKAQR